MKGGRNKPKNGSYPRWLTVFATSFLLIGWGVIFIRPDIWENATLVKQDFAPVIAALDHYRQDTGAYPETLKELEPKYMPAVPACPHDRWPHAY